MIPAKDFKEPTEQLMYDNKYFVCFICLNRSKKNHSYVQKMLKLFPAKSCDSVHLGDGPAPLKATCYM